MVRLSKQLAGLATKLVHMRHQDEAKIEARQLRKTLERMLARGVSDTELLSALNHDHWQNRLALRLAEAGLTMEVTP